MTRMTYDFKVMYVRRQDNSCDWDQIRPNGVDRSARSIFPDNLKRDFFRGCQIAPRRSTEKRTGGLLRPPGRFCNRIATRARSFFAACNGFKAGRVASVTPKEGPGWWHSRWDPSFLPASGGSRRSFPGIRYAHRSCPQMISSIQLAPARALRYIRSRVDPEKLRRNINAVTLIYYRCKECGKRFYYQHLLDYDDILSRIIASQKVSELISQCAIYFLFDLLFYVPT